MPLNGFSAPISQVGAEQNFHINRRPSSFKIFIGKYKPFYAEDLETIR